MRHFARGMLMTLLFSLMVYGFLSLTLGPCSKLQRSTKMRPRWLAAVQAVRCGYFWIPCPICKKRFAGFEWRGDAALWDGPPDDFRTGIGVCPDCAEKAKQINHEKWGWPMRSPP